MSKIKFKKIISFFVSLAVIMSVIITFPTSYFAVLKTKAVSPSMETALIWAVNVANDQSHGYSQQLRDGNPDYDCSSLVYYALKSGGFTLKNSKGTTLTYAFDTSSMHNWLTNSGFMYITMSSLGNNANVQRGDILWKSGHTEMYLGNGEQVGAHGNQPKTYSPNRSSSPGDQADEISVSKFNFNNWEGVFRYTGYIPDPEPDPIPDPIFELVTPTISTDKSSYNIGDTVNISWAASPSGSNLSHYWLNVIAPDGTWIYGGTMNKETSYSFVASQAGDYSITTYATPIGSKEGENSLTDTKTISVKSVDPSFSISDHVVNINMENNKKKYVEFSYSNYDDPITISFKHEDMQITNLEWGSWDNNKIKLYITGTRTGSEFIKVTFKNSDTSEILHEFNFPVIVSGTFYAEPEHNEYVLDLDNPKATDIIFRLYNVPTSGKLAVNSFGGEIDDSSSNGIIKGSLSTYRDGDKYYLKATVLPNKIGTAPIFLDYIEEDGLNRQLACIDIQVIGDPIFDVSPSNLVVIDRDQNETKTITFSYLKSKVANPTFIQTKRNNLSNSKISYMKWGTWNSEKIDLKISGNNIGEEIVTVQFCEDRSKNILASIDVHVIVIGTPKITFNPNGGEVSITEKKVEINSELGELPIPVRDGYTFIGWSYDSPAFPCFASSEDIINKDITLTALWQKNTDIIIDVKVNGEKNYAAKPGEIVTVSVDIDGADDGYASGGLRIEYDELLEIIPYSNGSYAKVGNAVERLSYLDKINIEANPNIYFFSFSGSGNYGKNGNMFSLNFKITENAKVGEELLINGIIESSLTENIEKNMLLITAL